MAKCFRSTFRDSSADQTDYPREVCELVFAHKLPDEVKAAYLGDAHLERRIEFDVRLS